MIVLMDARQRETEQVLRDLRGWTKRLRVTIDAIDSAVADLREEKGEGDREQPR